ncbi:hypothetical protein N8612_06210, partial [Verrucomicrobia bacterium]|nr:hypothetical protein [Verrucomicrobiota bacterium]
RSRYGVWSFSRPWICFSANNSLVDMSAPPGDCWGRLEVNQPLWFTETRLGVMRAVMLAPRYAH